MKPRDGNGQKPKYSKVTFFLKALVVLGAAWALGILKARMVPVFSREAVHL